jgi:hypothetical protein|tara:strand:- start:23041 stop:23646 length:606 start_codon:yes stop_codon:yes gene_type:complete
MDQNERLMAMLGGAKQVMDKVGNANYKVDHARVQEGMSGGDVQLLDAVPNGAVPQGNPTRPMGNSYKNLETSKMPQAIKDAMISNPIPQMEMASGGGPTFNLNDVKSLVRPQGAQQQQPQAVQLIQPQVSHQMNENSFVNSQGKMLVTLTEAELDKKINDALLQFMATTFTKELKENTIKRTITTLIKEGKIKVSPKKTTK